MNGFEIAATGLGSIGVLLVARGPIVRWYRKVHRRRGGVYLWRVRPSPTTSVPGSISATAPATTR